MGKWSAAAAPRPVPAAPHLGSAGTGIGGTPATGGAGMRVAFRTPRCGGTARGPSPSCPPAPGGTHAPHLPRLLARHRLCPAVPRTFSLSFPIPGSRSRPPPTFFTSAPCFPTAPGPARCPCSRDSHTANPSFRPPPLAAAGRAQPLGLGLGLRHH